MHTSDFSGGLRYLLEATTGGGVGSGGTIPRGCASSEEIVNGGIAG
jgi:hypothetical protein